MTRRNKQDQTDRKHFGVKKVEARAMMAAFDRLRPGCALARVMIAAGLLLAGCSAGASPSGPSQVSAKPVSYLRHSSSAALGPQKPGPQKPSGTVTASKYSSGLAGNCTSNGERYNPNGLTAASRTLPMGSTVKVTNVKNGSSVKVRINDRGPYVRGRSLDVSTRAAHEIGLGDKGLAKVKITPQQTSAVAAAPAHCD
jgi:rare lipoprotein A (peptidoglycan hydrolase)